jgi:hypothetical protein
MKLDAYKLKMIAIIGMIISHLPYAFWAHMNQPLRIITGVMGAVTFTIMAYFLAEGYRHTSNVKKYMLRLLIVGLIAQPFHHWIIGMYMIPGINTLNIMFSMLSGLLVLALYDKIKIKPLFWILFVIVIVPVSTLLLEFYFIGQLTILLNHVIKKEKVRRIVPSIVQGLLMVLLSWSSLWQIQTFNVDQSPVLRETLFGLGRQYSLMLNADFMIMTVWFGIASCFTGVLLYNYTGERGKKSKWFFYIVYPAHLALFTLILLFI